jgi:hypothetical protein
MGMQTTTMATNERLERFKAEAADLNLKAGNAGRERLWMGAGLALMGIGVVVALLAYQASLSADDSRDIQSYTILAVAMVGVVIAGAAVFLRYSLARFLRLWLLRQLYEGQAHLDQVVQAIERRDRP